MTYKQALEYIHSRPRVQKTSGHKAISKLLEMLDNPQDELKYVHIAGTNGKGSCAKMLSNVLIKSGYKVGLNISPFVIDFTERISINNNYIQKQSLVQIVEKIKLCQEKIEQQYGYIIVEFEVVTALSFCYFAQEKCDIVCLEVGIGGLKDTTNIIKNSLVSCIMNISYDHMELLGDSIEKIAFQKAGIIKPNQQVICYPKMDKLALKVIKQVANEKNSQLILPKIDDIKTENIGLLKTRLIYKVYNIIQSFTGQHQSYNTAVVIEAANALKKLGYNIIDSDIVFGIENSKFPARIEIISQNPLVILDGAHNLDGVCALEKVLQENNLKNLTAIWATLSDKEPKKIIEKMSPYISRIYTVDLSGPRAVDKNKLAEMAKKYIKNAESTENISEAIEKAINSQAETILIFGSLYLASDARKLLIK